MRHSDQTRLAGMLELMVASLGSDQNPPVSLEPLDDLPAVHSMCIIHTGLGMSNRLLLSLAFHPCPERPVVVRAGEDKFLAGEFPVGMAAEKGLDDAVVFLRLEAAR